MALDSPETYGEQYWAPQVEAQEAFAEIEEDALKPFIPSVFTDPGIREAMPFDILSKIEGLLQFEHPGLAGVGGRFVSEIADVAVGAVLKPALRQATYAANLLFQNNRMSAAALTELFYRGRAPLEAMEGAYAREGYGFTERSLLKEAARPFPTIPEVIRFARYTHGETGLQLAAHNIYDILPEHWSLWEWLTQSQLTFEQINSLSKRKQISEAEWKAKLEQLGWTIDKHGLLDGLRFQVPNAMLLLQADLFSEQEENIIDDDLAAADIHPDYRGKYIDAVLTKPNAADLIRYHLRQENDLTNLSRDLTRIGIHSEFHGYYHTLAHPIPPLPDLITMAVREAFSPEVAARFGQYEDFPRDFAKYAEQQGMSANWAERYWAAHWNLPSPQQGFEMLHRGVISVGDLNMLLRAQDVMPFWRDKLVAIAYRPLTRVDVRRMYKEGVLTEQEVFQAYLDQGYDDENAGRMTEFTIKQTLTSLSKFSTADVIRAFTQRMISRSEAGSLIRELGVRSTDVDFILRSAEYKREWQFTEERIKAIRNLYKKGEYTADQSQSALGRLNLPADQSSILMEQWWYEVKETPPARWSKSEIIKFVAAKTITRERGEQELRLLRYDDEHIEIYLRPDE